MFRNRLEQLVRNARARMPSKARDIVDRIEGVVRPRPVAPAAAPPVVEKPATPAPKPVSWELRSQAEIVDHIEQHYHAGLRRDLPALIEGARRVEREHAGHAAVPGGLASLLETFASELEGHMQKEERGHADPHDGARARRPRGRARARSRRQHIYLENNVLFARAVGGES